MRKGIRRLLLLPLTAGLSVVADQASKYLVRSNLTPGRSVCLRPWLEPVFHITYVTNTGAAFGLFPGWSEVFIIIGFVVVVALVWYYLQVSHGELLVQLALGLQLGGAVGNLIDRLRFGGLVIDFIDLNFWPLRRWPVFNVADASIVAGVTLLTLLMIVEGWREESSARQLATAADE